MKSLFKSTLLIAMGSAFAASSAMGAFTFTNGDLILGFQATSGTGSTTNVFFNLGSGTSHRDTPSLGPIGNISTTLTAVYGANWYTRSDLWFGVIGNLNSNANTGIGAAPAVNGDPSRTLYVSTATVNPGEGQLYAAASYPGAALASAETALSGMETMLVGLNTNPDGSATLNQATQPVEWSNGWSTWNPFVSGGQAAAFNNVLTGGIQQNFGKATSVTSVDLQRVLSTNTGAVPTGVLGGGTYETTFAIGSNGSISAIPEPSSSLLVVAAGALAVLRRRRNS